MEPNVLEGTWEELRGYESRLAGHRVRVTILDHEVAPTGSVNQKFTALAARWRAETAWTSSVSQMVRHPAYQEMIGRGRDVVPALLHALAHQPEHWFWALRALTGEDPVRPEQRGHMDAMTQAWLPWGREHGYHA
jgi:hypothetical protein